MTRTLYIHDNLQVLRGLDTGSVDLIATDPPFNSKRVFNAPAGSKAEGQRFDDRWCWNDVENDWRDLLAAGHTGVAAVIETAAVIEGGRVTPYGVETGRMKNSLAAFLCWIAPRLVEMWRVLKPTGSLYLHCDTAANSYLRLMLDAIFGRGGFRNEIIWCYTGPSAARKDFPKKHDTIFRYAVGEKATFVADAIRIPYKADFTPARGVMGSNKGSGSAERHALGKLPSDWWADPHLSNVSAWRKELTGWATQKPVALYERIIKASSNEGDLVLDPFCGCSTTLVAAERLGRQWIGCDIDPKAEAVVREQMAKLLDERLSMDVRKSPPKRQEQGG